MSLFFDNALAGLARQNFLTYCSRTMPFHQIFQNMERHYNSDTRKLQLQSEVDSLDLQKFMNKHQIVDTSTGLTKLVDYINVLAPQLPECFGNDSHKTIYLGRAVMRLELAQQPISQMATSRCIYSYSSLLLCMKVCNFVKRYLALKRWLQTTANTRTTLDHQDSS